jgi:5-methylcytosine-specific restriction protein A
MGVREFVESEQEYLDWLKGHPTGFVINSWNPASGKYLVLHSSQCKTICKPKKGAHPACFTGNGYFKICAEEVKQLHGWIVANGFTDFSSHCQRCNPTGDTQTQRLNWTQDELILALDLYFKAPASHGNDKHPGVIELSELLQDLPIHPIAMRLPNFRNANGVALKLVNFRTLDPSHSGTGMDQGARMDREVWNQYAEHLDLLAATALAIREHYKTLSPIDLIAEDGNDGVSEGGLLRAVHNRYERDSKIVRKKKRAVFELTMALKCEICHFDFAEEYGELGSEFAECHHTRPVSQMQAGDKTRLEDLSIVCANCHRMLHRNRELLSIEALKNILEKEKALRALKKSFGGGGAVLV